MRIISHILLIISILSIVQSYSVTLNTVGRCLSNLVTKEFTNSYNYLQLSSKLGTTDAYPGFSSLFIKLSDDDVSKAHNIVKFLALRKIQLRRLISNEGIDIRTSLSDVLNITESLTEARLQNKETWELVQKCHQNANNVGDANIQDYLESEILEHHVKIDKLLADFEHRINDPQKSDKELSTFMLDEELLNTYGDRRKDIFS